MRSSASAYRSSASLISRQPSGSSQPAGPVAGDESGRARMLSDRAGMILGMTAQPVTDVILEIGKKRVFACAAAWPGWCRSGRSEELALETLAAYLPRYAPVARLAGLALPPGAADAFAVTERLPGTAGYTDFGAPGEIAAGDYCPLAADEAGRMAALVQASWVTFGGVARAAPAELRKGPPGGGRDTDQIVEHVIGAEASFARKIGFRHRRPAAGDEPAIAAMRAAIIEALGHASAQTAPTPGGWPARYAARRIAWHVLDHAWEIEDESEA